MSLILSSCYTEKKATKQLNKANDIHPAVVADFTRKHYPCIVKGDTIFRTDTSYEFIEITCPESVKNSDTVIINNIKYVYKKGRTAYLPSPIVTKYVKIMVKDSAEVSLLEYRLNKCQEDKDNYFDKSESKGDWIKWLLIALGISALLNIILVIKK